MNVLIEFSGAPKASTGVKQLPLTLKDGATYEDVIHEISQRYPALTGVVIDQNGCNLLSGNFFNVNGEDSILPGMTHQSPRDGER
jgi:hypothetical protein